MAQATSHATPEALIRYLNPKLMGWANYYRAWVSKDVFGYVDHEVWKAIWKWCLQRHPNKGKPMGKAEIFPHHSTVLLDVFYSCL